MSKPSIERLRFCNFKLRTLLNITTAINQNLPTKELLFKFEQILSDELNIGRFLLYSKLDMNWQMMLYYGIEETDYAKISIEKDLLSLTKIEIIIGGGDDAFEIFDFIIPIFKDNKILAYVLMGDIDDQQIGTSPSLRHLQFIQTLTNVILVAIQNKELVRKSVIQERIKKELEMAARIQEMLVPSTEDTPTFDNITIKQFYMSHYEVGGDLYDFGEIGDNKMFFCIADVSGKGMSAAMIMSNFQANLKAQLRTKTFDINQIILNLNKNIIKISKGEHFVTMFLAVYDVVERSLMYVNAGHLPPVLYEYKTQKLNLLKSGCPGLGMLDDINYVKIGKKIIENSSKFICFTDGLSEYSIDNKIDFGLSVAHEAMKKSELNIEQTIDYIVDKINISKENENIFDDVTMLGIEFH